MSITGLSASLPLHEGLIVTANGVEVRIIRGEGNTDDVLGVTSEGSGLSASDAGVVEQVHETVIVTGGEQHLVVGAANGVDMSTIGGTGVDTLALPKELAGDGSPLSVLKVGSARCVLRAVFGFEEEELVGTTVGSEELGVSAPVKSHDVRAVTSAFTSETPVANIVDIDEVIVGTDGEHSAVRGEGHDLDPLCGIGQELELLRAGSSLSDRDSTVITSNGHP